MRTSFLSFIYSVLLLLFFTSCEEEQISLEDDGKVTLRVTAQLPDAAITRTTYTSSGVDAGVKVEWEEGDDLMLYGLVSKQGYNFAYSQEEKYGSHWTYTDASYQDGENLIGIYPASMVKGTTAICNFSGQDGTLENLKKYDLMISKESLLSRNKVDLQFSHINTFLRLLVPKTTLPYKSGVSIVLFGDGNSKNSSISLNITDTNQITRSGSESIEIICTSSPKEEEQSYCYYVALPSGINVRRIDLRKNGVTIITINFKNLILNGGFIYQASLIGSNNTILKCENLSSLFPENTKKIIFKVNSPVSSGTVVSEFGDYPAFLNVSNDVVTISTLSSTLYASQSCEKMFYGLKNLESIESLYLLNTSRVRNMRSMFEACNSLKVIDMTRFDTHMVEDMYHMFNDCQSLTSLSLASFDTQQVKDMSRMFGLCYSLTSIHLSNFDTRSVNDMSGMFSNCSSLVSADLTSFQTQKVKDMSYMFNRCSLLKVLDLSKFNTASLTDVTGMFQSCTSLSSLDMSLFKVDKISESNNMFNSVASQSGKCTIKCTPQAKSKFSSSTNFPASRIIWVDSTTGQSM